METKNSKLTKDRSNSLLKVLGSKKFALFAIPILLVAIGVVVYFCFFVSSSWPVKIYGSTQCINEVKKFEGKNYTKIYSLDCSINAVKISNSNIKAQLFEYTGLPQDSEDCVSPLTTSYCTGFSGVITRNDRYRGVGYGQGTGPNSYDYCYSSQEYAKPTITDLYFYKGNLYDRLIYKNVNMKVKFGDCIINGTTLATQSKDVEVYLTNVTVGYKNFPTSCDKVTIGDDESNYFTCIDQVTAANASLTDSCYTNQLPIFKNNLISGYQTDSYFSTTGDCDAVYEQRMAALNECNLITDSSIKRVCIPLVSHPDEYTTRTTASL